MMNTDSFSKKSENTKREVFHILENDFSSPLLWKPQIPHLDRIVCLFLVPSPRYDAM
jgi:hypothetical protein